MFLFILLFLLVSFLITFLLFYLSHSYLPVCLIGSCFLCFFLYFFSFFLFDLGSSFFCLFDLSCLCSLPLFIQLFIIFIHFFVFIFVHFSFLLVHVLIYLYFCFLMTFFFHCHILKSEYLSPASMADILILFSYIFYQQTATLICFS